MFRLRMNLLKQSDLGVNMKQQLIPVWVKSEIFQVNDTQWWKSMAPAISPMTLCEKTDYPVHKFPNKGVACHPAFSLTRKALEVTDDAQKNPWLIATNTLGFKLQQRHTGFPPSYFTSSKLNTSSFLKMPRDLLDTTREPTQLQLRSLETDLEQLKRSPGRWNIPWRHPGFTAVF